MIWIPGNTPPPPPNNSAPKIGFASHPSKGLPKTLKIREIIKIRMEAILKEIGAEGLDPKDLPAYRNGQPSIKAKIKEKMLQDRPPIVTNKTFDNAWQNLLNIEKINWGNE